MILTHIRENIYLGKNRENMYYPADENLKNNYIAFLNGLYRMTEAYKNKGVKGKLDIEYVKKIRRRLIELLRTPVSGISKNTANYILPCADYKRPENDAYFSDQRIAVYSSIFGPYDKIIEPVFKPDNVDYYLITDNEVPDNSLWHSIDPKDVIPDSINDNIFKNRYVKMMPHLFLKDYNYSVYIDGNVMLTSDATVFTASLEDFPVAMHRHKSRDCAYEEVKACIIKGKDDKKRLEDHANLLKEHKLPKHFGLLEAPIIARKHNDKLCIELMEKWWEEFQSASHRDQISLVDCIWTMGLDINSFAQLGNNIYKNHHLIFYPHTWNKT